MEHEVTHYYEQIYQAILQWHREHDDDDESLARIAKESPRAGITRHVSKRPQRRISCSSLDIALLNKELSDALVVDELGGPPSISGNSKPVLRRSSSIKSQPPHPGSIAAKSALFEQK